MQQTFTIPLQDQAKFELKLRSQEVSTLKANNLCITIGTLSSSLTYFGHSTSGKIQQC